MLIKSKTIFYIGGFELPDKNAAAQRVLSNAKILKELGYRVILVGVDKMIPSTTDVCTTKTNVQGFETWSIPYPSTKVEWLKYITTNNQLAHLIESEYENSVFSVICYNYPAFAQYRIKKMCLSMSALYIADATEWYESSGGSLLFRIIKKLDTSLRMRLVHLTADGIITTSRYLTDFYKSKRCVTVELPTLYDPSLLKPEDLVTESEGTDKCIKFMYAGSAFNIKRVNSDRSNIKDRIDKIIVLFSALDKMNKNFILSIYGLTSENYLNVFPEHKALLKRLSSKVVFYGRKPHQYIIEHIKQSDFTIFLREIDRVIEAGFPSKFSESISCGTPVISNLISNIEPYVVDGKNGRIIELNDLGEQVRVMSEIFDLDRHRLKTMKVYCLKNQVFSYKNYIEPVKDFFLKLTKDGLKKYLIK